MSGPERLDAAEVLKRYEDQVRRSAAPIGPGWTVEHGYGGRVLRHIAPADSQMAGVIAWTDLTAADVDAAIAEQVDRFRPSGRSWEWKTYGHDTPGDLPERLEAAGLVPEEPEALVVGSVGEVAAATVGSTPPVGVTVREVRDAADYDAIGGLLHAVWGGDHAWLTAEIAAEKAADPQAITVLVAETDTGEVVSAGWVRFQRGTEFASLWGGATLKPWRGRGIYRALVARRAALAAERGFAHLQVDASPDSRPILERLGLHVLATTTPYIWQP